MLFLDVLVTIMPVAVDGKENRALADDGFAAVGHQRIDGPVLPKLYQLAFDERSEFGEEHVYLEKPPAIGHLLADGS